MSDANWPVGTGAGVPAITFYLDFVSPYAYLAFEALPQALQGLSYTVRYQPVLLGAIFKQLGHDGPAAIPAKHAWIARHVAWLARQQGLALKWPQPHPFRSVEVLRLALACGSSVDGLPNRWVCESIFHHLWADGHAAGDAAQLDALTAVLSPRLNPSGSQVKQALQEATAQAVARGVFGVPSFAVDDALFWGLDALPMLRGHLTQSG
jgi:2-hydroxychromene-2-carboxylate isomerase